jgi:hypothetical protein
MFDEQNEETSFCLVDGCYGIYVPQRFAVNYSMPSWNVKAEDAAILIEGPDNLQYDETWDEVLKYAKCQGFTLSQDGDLFAVKI